jgi:hypothetical protein
MWWHRPSVYLAFVITCALIGPAPSTMAASVSAGKVLGACKRTKGCYTTTTGNGAIWGCSAHACFVCYKGKCTPQPAPDVRANPPKTGPGGGNSAGTTTAASGSATGQKNEHPITNVHQPVVLQHSGSSHSGGSKH